MRFAVVAAAATVGVASASYTPSNGTAPVYVTEVVTAFTTYCPEATTLVHGEETYTVSEATTLTITNCPGGCTITKPVSSATEAAPVPYTSASEVAPVETSAEAAPVPYTSAPAANGTIAASGTGSPVTSATGTGSPIATFTGAANKAYSAAGAGFLAIFGLVAAL